MSDGVESSFWQRGDIDSVVLAQDTHGHPEHSDWQGTSDARVVFRLAYGQAGLYMHVVVSDDSWTERDFWFWGQDVLTIYLDSMSSDQIAACQTGCLGAVMLGAVTQSSDLLLFPIGSPSQNYIGMFGCGPPDCGGTVPVPVAYADASAGGYLVEELRPSGSARALELVIPWRALAVEQSQVQSGDSLARGFSLVYTDRDIDEGDTTNALVLCTKDPLTTDPWNGDTTRSWADIVFGGSGNAVVPRRTVGAARPPQASDAWHSLSGRKAERGVAGVVHTGAGLKVMLPGAR
ncbi:MAG: hypothetical protein GF331_26270 [Chitinivibrionales bacterium]|nr:hypothetical protein [Chitinivibrionales bacterium]